MSAIDGLQFVSEDKFKNSEYYEQYGGDYNKYYQAYIKETPLFLNRLNCNIDLAAVSLFATKPNNVTQYAANPNQDKDIQQYIDKVHDSKLPDELKAKFIEDIKSGHITRDFVDMLIEKHMEGKERYEALWAEYQESKDLTSFLKGVFNVMAEKYGESTSNYEQGMLTDAEKAYNDAEGDEWSKLLACRNSIGAFGYRC